ncbi:Sugar phosphate transporter domain-containing protein [Plasmodiophora brassicae]
MTLVHDGASQAGADLNKFSSSNATDDDETYSPSAESSDSGDDAGRVTDRRSCFGTESNRLVFFGWFLLTGFYYSSRFKTLESVPVPWTFMVIQSVLGIPIIGVAWLIRRSSFPSQLSFRSLSQLLPLAICHTVSHLVVLDVSANTPTSMYFYEVVRAAEPLFTAALAYKMLDERYNRRSYIFLVLFVASLACAGAYFLEFNAANLILATVTTVASSLRFVYARRALSMPEVDGPVNLYFLLSIMSASIVMFIALFFNVAEGFKEFELLWDRIALSTKGSGRIAIWITLSGTCFFFQNLLSFCFLSYVNAVVPHSFATTFVSFLGKRFALLSPFLFFIPILALPEFVGSILASLFIYLFIRAKNRVISPTSPSMRSPGSRLSPIEDASVRSRARSWSPQSRGPRREGPSSSELFLRSRVTAGDRQSITSQSITGHGPSRS